MKKKLSLLLALLLLCSLALTACSSDDGGDVITVKVGASITPHAEILKVAQEILAAKDVELEIVEFTDYVQPNLVVDNGEIDANYFQHLPYLEDFNAENGTKLVSVSVIHVEPMGLYGGRQTTLDALGLSK